MNRNERDIKQILLKYEFGNFAALNSTTPVDLDSAYFADTPGIVGCFKNKSGWHVYETSLEGFILNKRRHKDQVSAYTDAAKRLGLRYAVNIDICSFYNNRDSSLKDANKCANMAMLVEKVLRHIEKRNAVMKAYNITPRLDSEIELLKQELCVLRESVLLNALPKKASPRSVVTKTKVSMGTHQYLSSKNAGNRATVRESSLRLYRRA
ncbi:MAG: hypothetical protein IJR47_03450 [Clostridia bacterium]|nr:hypothetical protein [Clostridia bacterium]